MELTLDSTSHKAIHYIYVLKFLHKAILNQLIHESHMDSARTEEVRVERKEMRWEGKERIEPCLLPAGRRRTAAAGRGRV